MNRKNVYMYIVSGVFFGLLYSLIPAYINVIFTQKIIEYLLDMRIPNMVTLSLLSMVAIIIAEILNSIYERCIKPEIRIKIHSDTISYVFNKLKKY